MRSIPAAEQLRALLDHWGIERAGGVQAGSGRR